MKKIKKDIKEVMRQLQENAFHSPEQVDKFFKESLETLTKTAYQQGRDEMKTEIQDLVYTNDVIMEDDNKTFSNFLKLIESIK